MSRFSREVLFVMAHQDDECFLSTRIEREAGSPRPVRCVFLTAGRVGSGDPRRRDAESLRVLSALGVPPDRVHFLGSDGPFPDGELHLHLEGCLGGLAALLETRSFHRIYTTAYEGGHQDHDATHLIALAFARQRNLLGRTWQAPLYNGHQTSWRFFRVMKPLPGPGVLGSRRLPAGEARRHALLCFRYPSQWRSWIGLAPGYLVRRILSRQEVIRSVEPRLLRTRPHEGPLLYERMRSCTYESFRDAAGRFIDRHLPG